MSGEGDDPDTVAAEYVVGLLTADEMRAVSERAVGDAGLRTEITAWEVRLAPLAALVAPVTPPSGLWARLERSVATAAPAPANDNLRRPGLWRSLAFWRAATAAGLALAAGFAAVTLVPREAPAPTRLAALAPLGGPAVAFVAEMRPDGVLQVTAIAPASVPPGRELELWVLPRGATRPASLGTFPLSGRRIAATASQVPEGAQLLVSLEPAGGSPTGQPTGAVLYGGVVTAR